VESTTCRKALRNKAVASFAYSARIACGAYCTSCPCQKLSTPVRESSSHGFCPKTYDLHAVCVVGLKRLITRHLSESRLVYGQARACLTGMANAGYARVTANRQFPFVSMATTLSGPVSDTGGPLISQRFALAVVSGRSLQNPRMKSSSVCVHSCSAFRGSDRCTAAVSIRQGHHLQEIKQKTVGHPRVKALPPAISTREICPR
jgi:hypothetical protein